MSEPYTPPEDKKKNGQENKKINLPEDAKKGLKEDTNKNSHSLPSHEINIDEQGVNGMQAKILQKKTVFQHGFLSIEEASVEIPMFAGGRMLLHRYGLLRPLVVVVTIYLSDVDKVVFVQQFRYSAMRTCNGWVTEVVAGLVEKGEDLQAAARREAAEETGYGAAGKLHYLARYYPSVGLSDQLIESFLLVTTTAGRAGSGGGLAEEGEDIRVLHMKRTKAMNLLASGYFDDAKTIIALHSLQQFLNKNQL